MASSSSAVRLHMRLFPSDKGSKRPHVILACCGSVAAVKFQHLCFAFSEWAEVTAVISKNAIRFIGNGHFPDPVFLYSDNDEFFFWKLPGKRVLHIDLQKWADIMVIAPLSANTLAKITGGLCDNLMTCIVRAWDYQKKPMFVAPAMNKLMWNNPSTEEHLGLLEAMGVNLIMPISSGNSTTGAMAEVSYIDNTIRRYWFQNSKSGQSGGR